MKYGKLKFFWFITCAIRLILASENIQKTGTVWFSIDVLRKWQTSNSCLWSMGFNEWARPNTGNHGQFFNSGTAQHTAQSVSG